MSIYLGSFFPCIGTRAIVQSAASLIETRARRVKDKFKFLARVLSVRTRAFTTNVKIYFCGRLGKIALPQGNLQLIPEWETMAKSFHTGPRSASKYRYPIRVTFFRYAREQKSAAAPMGETIRPRALVRASAGWILRGARSQLQPAYRE